MAAIDHEDRINKTQIKYRHSHDQMVRKSAKLRLCILLFVIFLLLGGIIYIAVTWITMVTKSDKESKDQKRCDFEFSFKGKCYYFGDTGLTWLKAKQFCERKKAHLVKIDDKNVYKWLVGVVKGKKYNQIWIGANDREKEGVWVWDSDKTKLNYTEWARYEPNDSDPNGGEDCGSMKKNRAHKWNDLNCNELCNFICEK